MNHMIALKSLESSSLLLDKYFTFNLNILIHSTFIILNTKLIEHIKVKN